MKIHPRKVARLTTMQVALVLLSVVGWSSAFGQTINDPAQGEKYGVWKVMNAQYPGIQTRAKCDTDVELNGRMTSSWEYQVRSTYKGTVDYVYLVGFGSPITHLNEMTGPFLATAKPGDVTQGLTELYGICGEHSSIKTGLHITIKCAVPTGQDAPCFKDANGNEYPRRQPDNNTQAESSQNAAAPSQPAVETIFCYGWADYETDSSKGSLPRVRLFTQIFSCPNIDAYQLALWHELQNWVSTQYGWSNNPPQELVVRVERVNTRADAEKRREWSLAHVPPDYQTKEITWNPTTPVPQ